MKYQRTLKKTINFEGVGLHTGVMTRMSLFPSEPNTGIIFKRVDLENPVYIKADLDNVIALNRGTSIGKDNVEIHTVEHILSSLNGLGVDNVLIEIDNSEVPICDGSSQMFCNEIINAGIEKFDIEKKYYEVKSEISYHDDSTNSYIKIKPYNGFKVSCEIDFNIESIGSQFYEFDGLDNYLNEISKSRTFCTFDEISKLQESNLALGGSLNNALIFSDNSITIDKIKSFNTKFNLDVNESIEDNNVTIANKKLYFENEPARHKALDLIGDFALLGNLKGHVISFKGGHRSNIKILKKVKKQIESNNNFKFNKEQIKEIIPHRDPFLLIDEIIDGVDGDYVCALKYVNKNEHYFKGHFPNKPMMPGVLIIECMAQTSCFLDMKNTHNRNKKLMLLSVVKSAKFLHKVLPGDKLHIKTKLLKYKLGTARVRGIARVNNKIVAEAEWMATMVERD